MFFSWYWLIWLSTRPGFGVFLDNCNHISMLYYKPTAFKTSTCRVVKNRHCNFQTGRCSMVSLFNFIYQSSLIWLSILWFSKSRNPLLLQPPYPGPRICPSNLRGTRKLQLRGLRELRLVWTAFPRTSRSITSARTDVFQVSGMTDSALSRVIVWQCCSKQCLRGGGFGVSRVNSCKLLGSSCRILRGSISDSSIYS